MYGCRLRTSGKVKFVKKGGLQEMNHFDDCKYHSLTVAQSRRKVCVCRCVGVCVCVYENFLKQNLVCGKSQ